MFINADPDELGAMMLSLGGIIAYGTEHDDDHEKFPTWIAVLQKLRVYYDLRLDDPEHLLEITEDERSTIEGAMSYATGFYSLFRYIEGFTFISACETIKMDPDYLSRTRDNFKVLRSELVKTHGEAFVASVDARRKNS